MFLWPCIVSKAWRKNTNKMEQYRWFIVNCRCWLLTTVSTCFGHLYAHHQEKSPRVTAYGVYLLVVLDVAGCGAVVLRWGCDHCESNSNLHSYHTLNVAPQYRNLPHPTLPANTLHMQWHVVFSPDDGHKDARNMSRLLSIINIYNWQ